MAQTEARSAYNIGGAGLSFDDITARISCVRWRCLGRCGVERQMAGVTSAAHQHERQSPRRAAGLCVRHHQYG